MEEKLGIESNNIPSYRIEGFIALAVALHCFVNFTVYFYGGHFPNGVSILTYCLIFPFDLFLIYKLFVVFDKILNEKIIAIFLFIGILLIILMFLSYILPLLLFQKFGYDVFHSDEGWGRFISALHTILRYMFEVYFITRSIFYFRFKGPMKRVVLFLGLQDVPYAAVMLFTEPGNIYLFLMAAINYLTIAYFFFYLKDEMKNFQLKNNSAVSDPEILDQI